MAPTPSSALRVARRSSRRRGATETRKVVTVVFTDVADSTALGERLDPESLRRVMWRYFDTMQATLERHGGTVEKFIGDAIVAVFGVPAVHEDDALRAVRAALEMREALESVNESLSREYGVRIGARTGVNTGEVIVGDAVADQKLATGDAVNVAARLEQAAEAGEILIGETTYRLVRDAVVVEPARTCSRRVRAGRLPPGGCSACGRTCPPSRARSPLPSSVGAASSTGSARPSRLRHASLRAGSPRSSGRRESGSPGWRGSSSARSSRRRVSSSGAASRTARGSPISRSRRSSARSAASTPRRRSTKLLMNVERGAVATRLILGAIGANDEPGSPEETAWAFRRLFETLALSRPLVVVVDDIHWAEPALLDLLEYVLGFSSGAPILLLCLARPDLFDTRPSWAAPRPQTSLVSLAPLSADESNDLVEGLLTAGAAAPAVRDRIVDAAEGNPLFVEQMLAMLADDPDVADDALPATIHALLAARIERLEPGERTVLQHASVEGRLFHRRAVAELLPPPAGRTDWAASFSP